MSEREVSSTFEDRADRPPTIYVVAEAAGVAASTVSRTFARPGRVNAATAERMQPLRTHGRNAVHAVLAARSRGSVRADTAMPLPVKLLVRDSTARRHTLSASRT